jgi:hypothetical protein
MKKCANTSVGEQGVPSQAEMNNIPQGVLCIPVCCSSHSDCCGGRNHELILCEKNRG